METFHGESHLFDSPKIYNDINRAIKGQKEKAQKSAINLHGANIILCRVSRHSQE